MQQMTVTLLPFHESYPELTERTCSLMEMAPFRLTVKATEVDDILDALDSVLGDSVDWSVWRFRQRKKPR
jgi:hypothetical protein